jgi:uncharacterized protein YdeI (YjbR/CyaY-like superfamily)
MTESHDPAPLDPSPRELIVADAAAWRAWLDTYEDSSDGVWLVLAKKGALAPTSLSYAEALDEALCSGWIDGQKLGRDAETFAQRFTPRRPRSMWSARNVEHVERLTAEGRLRARGRAEVELARADGRWDRAYAGSATAEVPEDLAAALAERPGAQEAFAGLSRAERYSMLHPVLTASTPSTRSARVARVVDRLVIRDSDQGATSP